MTRITINGSATLHCEGEVTINQCGEQISQHLKTYNSVHYPQGESGPGYAQHPQQNAANALYPDDYQKLAHEFKRQNEILQGLRKSWSDLNRAYAQEHQELTYIRDLLIPHGYSGPLNANDCPLGKWLEQFVEAVEGNQKLGEELKDFRELERAHQGICDNYAASLRENSVQRQQIEKLEASFTESDREVRALRAGREKLMKRVEDDGKIIANLQNDHERLVKRISELHSKLASAPVVRQVIGKEPSDTLTWALEIEKVEPCDGEGVRVIVKLPYGL